MKAHLRYLHYVLAHKFYVFRAGLAIATVVDDYRGLRKLAWLWRLFVHDLSKFSPAEWSPYVNKFYGPNPLDIATAELDARTIERERQAAFNYAWLHHQHVQPHHWQHHILHEDSGKTIVLTPPRVCVDEMVADWLAAGPKALRIHSMPRAVEETIAWYAKAHSTQMMRTIARDRAEALLLLLAGRYGITERAADIHAGSRARASITLNHDTL